MGLGVMYVYPITKFRKLPGTLFSVELYGMVPVFHGRWKIIEDDEGWIVAQGAYLLPSADNAAPIIHKNIAGIRIRLAILLKSKSWRCYLL